MNYAINYPLHHTTVTMADDNDSLSFYHYDPSEVAAGVLAIIFVISFLVTAFQIFRRRSWVWLVFLFAIGSASSRIAVWKSFWTDRLQWKHWASRLD